MNRNRTIHLTNDVQTRTEPNRTENDTEVIRKVDWIGNDERLIEKLNGETYIGDSPTWFCLRELPGKTA